MHKFKHKHLSGFRFWNIRWVNVCGRLVDKRSNSKMLPQLLPNWENGNTGLLIIWKYLLVEALDAVMVTHRTIHSLCDLFVWKHRRPLKGQFKQNTGKKTSSHLPLVVFLHYRIRLGHCSMKTPTIRHVCIWILSNLQTLLVGQSSY